MPVPIVNEGVDYDRAALADAAEALGLDFVVLFGSRGGGEISPSEESDLDLAVHVPAGTRCLEFRPAYRALAGVFDAYELDLAILNAADPLFRHEIMSNGTLLWGDLDAFYEYRAFAYRDFIDSADLRALEQELFLKKLAHIDRILNDPT